MRIRHAISPLVLLLVLISTTTNCAGHRQDAELREFGRQTLAGASDYSARTGDTIPVTTVLKLYTGGAPTAEEMAHTRNALRERVPEDTLRAAAGTKGLVRFDIMFDSALLPYEPFWWYSSDASHVGVISKGDVRVQVTKEPAVRFARRYIGTLLRGKLPSWREVTRWPLGPSAELTFRHPGEALVCAQPSGTNPLAPRCFLAIVE